MTKAPEALSVLHVSEPVDGGVARYVLDLVADQVGRGWRVAVVAPANEDFRTAVEGAGGRHLEWPLPVRLVSRRRSSIPAAAILRHLPSLSRTIRGFGPDVLHLHSSVAGIGSRLAVRGRVPTIFQPHAWSFLAVTGAARSVARWWERRAARWTDVVVCVSEAERRLGSEAGIRAEWRIVPNGVDLSVFTAASGDDRDAARGRLGLDSRPLVVSVGALRRQKGHDVLLRAWPSVVATVPGARLAIVGDGRERAALEQRAGEGVLFPGFRDDVPTWLAAADVVALPSRWEGMSLVLLEAMARGRSVVTTDVPGAREAVGEAGAVVPVEEAAPLALALAERLVDRERAAREGRAARTRVERSHDLRRVGANIAALYADLVSATAEALA